MNDLKKEAKEWLLNIPEIDIVLEAIIDRATLAERKRCAELVMNMPSYKLPYAATSDLVIIATAIEKGEL